MSVERLEVGGLYVLLFIRDEPPAPDDFHWGLYLHSDPAGGTKYHIKQQGAGWMTDHGRTGGVFKSFLLVGLIQIAAVPTGHESHVDNVLRSLDSSLNNNRITCRLWLLQVLALLQKPVNGYVILKCADLDELEKKLKHGATKMRPLRFEPCYLAQLLGQSCVISRTHMAYRSTWCIFCSPVDHFPSP